MRRCVLISFTIRENSSDDGFRWRPAIESSSSAISSSETTLEHDPIVETSRCALGRFRIRGDIVNALLSGDDDDECMAHALTHESKMSLQNSVKSR